MTNAERLAELSMPTELAAEVARQIADGTSQNAGIQALVVLTDSSGGTPSNTIAAVPGTYSQATLANQIASLATKVNEIIAALK